MAGLIPPFSPRFIQISTVVEDPLPKVCGPRAAWRAFKLPFRNEAVGCIAPWSRMPKCKILDQGSNCFRTPLSYSERAAVPILPKFPLLHHDMPLAIRCSLVAVSRYNSTGYGPTASKRFFDINAEDLEPCSGAVQHEIAEGRCPPGGHEAFGQELGRRSGKGLRDSGGTGAQALSERPASGRGNGLY